MGFVTVADDGDDAGNGSEFFRGALGIAASGDDSRRGVETMGTADVSTGFAVGFGSDAAGVDDDHVGFRWLNLGGVRGTQQRGDGFAVGTGGAAAEIFDVEGGRHGSSLAESAAVSRLLAALTR